ncbi:MAG: histidine triad nucleotide-binding protein [Deltaproteobacteria bacterium]|nr:histidine triad nucleotide-binding protein [Deltaproteobacteria bacterium]
MAECIFCRIIAKEIPCRAVMETEQILAFHDIQPKAPVHVLIVPKRHIATLSDFPDDPAIAGALFRAFPAIAKACGIDAAGYRVIANTGRDGGQEVFHVHFHLLGGRPLGGFGGV